MSWPFLISVLVALAVNVIVIGLIVRLVCACFSSEIRRRIKARPVAHAVLFILVIIIVLVAVTAPFKKHYGRNMRSRHQTQSPLPSRSPTSHPDARQSLYAQRCAELSTEDAKAFDETTYRDRISFVSHPKISSDYLQSIQSFFRYNETHIDRAKDWFQSRGIPVAYGAYHGCVVDPRWGASKFSYLAQKLDDTTWMIFAFGGYGAGKDYFYEAYLVRKNDQNERWIEDGVMQTNRWMFTGIEHKGRPFPWEQKAPVYPDADSISITIESNGPTASYIVP